MLVHNCWFIFVHQSITSTPGLPQLEEPDTQNQLSEFFKMPEKQQKIWHIWDRQIWDLPQKCRRFFSLRCWWDRLKNFLPSECRVSHLGKTKDRNAKAYQDFPWVLAKTDLLFTAHPHGCFYHLAVEYPCGMGATSKGNLIHPLLVCFVGEHLQMYEQKWFWSYIFKSEVVWGFSSEDNIVYLFIFLKRCCSSWSSPWHPMHHSASTEYSKTVLLLILRCKQKPITTWQKKRLNIDLSAERNWPKVIQNILWSTKYPLHGKFFFLFLFGVSQAIFAGSVYQELKAATLLHDCNFFHLC